MYECVKQDSYKGAWVPGCGNPFKISLDEPLDLVIRAVPAGKTTAIEVLNFGPAGLSLTETLPEHLTEPYEFDEFFGKMDLEDQAIAMDMEMPFERNAQNLVDKFFTADPNEEDDDSIPF